MKRVLPTGLYTFNPTVNQINFTPFAGFDPKCLYAVIDVTTGKLIYSTASSGAGFGGSFAGPVLTYASSNAGQLATDVLQVIYDDEYATQVVSGSVSVSGTSAVTGTVGSSGSVATAVHDGSGTFPILSSADPISGRDGLDINVLSSSFGGKINNPLPIPFQDQALSVGFLNGGDLVSPAMDATSNQLIVDATQSGNIPVTMAGTMSVSLDGIATSTPINTVNPELYVTGAGPQTAAGNNVLESVATANSTDVAGYRSGVVAIVSNSTTGTYIFEQSADNINFRPLAVFNAETANPNAVISAVTPTVSTTIFHFPIKARFIRCRIATVLNSTGIRAFSRFSQETWAPTAVQAINATASNLNVNVSGSLTSAGTVSTVTTVSTVSAVTAANLASASATDVAASTITTTTTSANIASTNVQAISFLAQVSSVTGTNPTLDISVQETYDGTNYFTIYDFERITAAGVFHSPAMRLTGIGYRFVRTVGGTTPSFVTTTVPAIAKVTRSGSAPIMRRAFDRTIAPNTLNSATPSLLVEGCDEFQLVVSSGAGATVNPVIKLQGSEDNSNWYDIPSMSITATPSATLVVDSNSSESMPKWIRAIVSTAGTGATLNYVALKGKSN